MNVVAFPSESWAGCRTWHHSELQKLVELYSAHAGRSALSGWDVGATDMHDPQFYVLGSGPDHDCVLSISRVGRRYVLEDGEGGVLAEDERLHVIAQKASKALAGRSKSYAYVARLFVSLCAFRFLIEQKLEPIMAESTETLTRFAPALAAYI